jgi:hypothetical protein
MHKNFLIIKKLGFLHAFKKHKILHVLEKCHNDLGKTLKLKVGHMPKYEEKIEENIPENC